MSARKPKAPSEPGLPVIRCAIIVDPFGSAFGKDGREETLDHIAKFSALLKERALSFTTPHYVDETMDADLVVFDYGGMSLGNDLMADNSRRLVRWMQDHPSGLVVVASSYTFQHGVFYELRAAGFYPEDTYRPWPVISDPDERSCPVPNMLIYTGYGEKIEARIRAWFGL